MLIKPLLVGCLLLTSACSQNLGGFLKKATPTVETSVSVSDEFTKRPRPRPETLIAEPVKTEPPIKMKPIVRPEQDKGLTIASLGLLDRPGLWLRTPLVPKQAEGRIVVEKTGASVNVTLLPNGAGQGAGSQVSASAMQVLGVSLTSLVELRVFVR